MITDDIAKHRLDLADVRFIWMGLRQSSQLSDCRSVRMPRPPQAVEACCSHSPIHSLSAIHRTQAKPTTRPSHMVTTERDVEAAYAPQASPKLDEFQQERPAVQGASIPTLLLASMPRMAIQVAWTAQLLAVGFAVRSKLAATFISIVAPLVPLIVSPIAGAVSDRCAHKWGRRRPFMVFASLASAVFMFLACIKEDIAEVFDGDYGSESTPYLAVIFYLFMGIAVSFMETPSMLLVADLAGDRQVTGAALGQGWSILGSVFVSVYIECFGAVSTIGAFAAVCTVLMLVIIAVVSLNINETPRGPSEATQPRVANTTATNLTNYGFMLVVIGYGIANYSSYRLSFFKTRVVSGSSKYSYYSKDSGLGDFKYFMIQSTFAYIFTWLLPFLTKKIGAGRVLAISLIPQTLFIIMAYAESKTLVGLIDFLVAVFRPTIFVLIVPAIVHVHGHHVNIGARVGWLSSVAGIGTLIEIAIGDDVTNTDLRYQLPVLLAGIMALVCIFMSGCMLRFKLKSL